MQPKCIRSLSFSLSSTRQDSSYWIMFVIWRKSSTPTSLVCVVICVMCNIAVELILLDGMLRTNIWLHFTNCYQMRHFTSSQFCQIVLFGCVELVCVCVYIFNFFWPCFLCIFLSYCIFFYEFWTSWCSVCFFFCSGLQFLLISIYLLAQNTFPKFSLWYFITVSIV